MPAPLYFDHAASTPVDPAVAAYMSQVLRSPSGCASPSAGHAPGRAAAAVVEAARDRVAALIGARPAEIIWTSGATESDNLAVMGAARFRRRRGNHIITTAIEHPAVLESCRALEREGFELSYLRPDHEGRIAPARVEEAMTSRTTLVSVMHANNEVGSVQDVGGIGSLCRQRDVLLHVDAAQSAGRLPLDVKTLGIDLLSLSAHKMHGPKGVGALYLDRDRCRRVEPLFHGGGQERGLRPGTLPTHQVAGMGLACQLAAARLDRDAAAIEALRARLWSALRNIPGVLRNGPAAGGVCHILNVSVPGVEGESLRLALRGLAVSSGSACASDTGEPSPVLRLLGRPDPLAEASIRFSLGRTTTAEEVDRAAELFHAAVRRLRALAPAQALAETED